MWRAVPEGARPERFEQRRAFLLAHVGAGERVLDLGCGDGTFAADLQVAGCEVIAVDVAEEALRRARQRVAGLDARLAVEGQPLPVDEDGADVVWMGETIEHIADVVGTLAEVRRVLRWGGRLLVTTPYHGRIAVAAAALAGRLDEHFDPRADHLRFFTARTLGAVLSDAGFAEVDVRPAGGLPLLRSALHAVAR